MQKKPLIKWRPEARSDLLNIVDYIAESNPTAADQLATLIEQKVQKLPDHPKLYKASTRAPGFRELVVSENYIVFYSEDSKLIEIVNVVHARKQYPPIE